MTKSKDDVNNESPVIVFIPGNIPSLKNSKINGRFPSKTVTRWLRTFGIKSYSSSRKEVFYFKKIPRIYNIEELLLPLKLQTKYPLLLGMHFVRNSKRSWDFNNATHIVLDLMTALDIIPDDNVNYVLPIPLKIDEEYWSYNKSTPGVFIRVL